MTAGSVPSGDTSESTADGTSLFRRLGGAWAIDVAVELFHRKVRWDDRVAHFFDGVDTDRQIARDVDFLTRVFGGPARYTGGDPAEAPVPLVRRGMTDADVDVVLELLADTLRLMKVDEDDVAEALRIIDGLRETDMGHQQQ